MPEYRRPYIPGGSYFLTLVAYNRNPLFQVPENISRLRAAIKTVKSERPFEIAGAVVLPDHQHFIWTLPPGDTAYSMRVGRLKALFTKSLPAEQRSAQALPNSHRKRRESGVWQRRFWEHALRDEEDFQRHLDYIHYNPVKHGYAQCPHSWPFSSFHQWVQKGAYTANWCCTCNEKPPEIPDFTEIESRVGE
jgi:putative transposase